MIDLSSAYIRNSEEISRTTPHLPGLFQVGENWQSPNWDFFSRALTIELANMGAHQAFLWKDHFLYEFGYKLLSPIKIEEKFRTTHRKMFQEYLPKRMVSTGNFLKEKWEFSTYTSIHSVGRANLVLLVVLEKNQPYKKSSWKNITEILEGLGYAYGGEERRMVPLFQDFSKFFLDQVHDKLYHDGYGVITHFYIQDLEKYFHAMGMQKSLEILKSIQSILGSHVKNEDVFVHQGPRSYFAFSPKCKKEIVLKRFEEVFLQIDHLIVDYRMRFLEVKSDSDLEEDFRRFLWNPDSVS